LTSVVWLAVSMRWGPPTESCERTAVASTRMPSPPSHWRTARHRNTAREWAPKSTTTVAPVVVIPLMLSNSAFTGAAKVPFPASTNGVAPTTATLSQVSDTSLRGDAIARHVIELAGKVLLVPVAEMATMSEVE